MEKSDQRRIIPNQKVPYQQGYPLNAYPQQVQNIPMVQQQYMMPYPPNQNYPLSYEQFGQPIVIDPIPPIQPEIIINQPVPIAIQKIYCGKHPGTGLCPYCSRPIHTKVFRSCNCATVFYYLTVILFFPIAMFFLCCGTESCCCDCDIVNSCCVCCCIGNCCDCNCDCNYCKCDCDCCFDSRHFCPDCGKFIGEYNTCRRKCFCCYPI